MNFAIGLSSINEATEELLRRYTFTVAMRRVTQDIDFAGHSLRTRDIVIV